MEVEPGLSPKIAKKQVSVSKPVVLKPAKPQQHKYENSETGIAALDSVLGGGFPKGSVVLLSGASGSGKTIFALQWLFTGARNGENGLYITLTEPLFKTLKNLETFDFYDRAAVESERLKVADLRDLFVDHDFDDAAAIKFIESEVRKNNVKRLCIDSVTAIAYSLVDKARVRKFIFDLGQAVATLGCTAVLTSESPGPKSLSVYGVEEFISDAIISLEQEETGGEFRRVMHIAKVRGREYSSQELFFKISKSGINAFLPILVSLDYSSESERVSTGNSMLDEMLFGGIFRGSTTLISGPTGTGKSLFALQFMIQGLQKGEKCLFVGYEESRDQIIRNAESMGWNFSEYEKKGLLFFKCAYPSERQMAEHLAQIASIVKSEKIKRCAVDSLSAVSSHLSEADFTSYANKLNGFLKSSGVTSFMTIATQTLVGASISERHLQSMADNFLLLQFVEIGGELSPVLNIIKVRGSSHSKGLKKYEITSSGFVMGESLAGYEQITTGVARKVSETVEEKVFGELQRAVGPMAAAVFQEIKQRGLSYTNIAKYVDEMVSQKIMAEKDAAALKENVKAILSGENA